MDFLTLEAAFADVRAYLPAVLSKRGLLPEAIGELLEREALGRLSVLLAPVAREVYADLEVEACRRLSRRDESDRPFVALALRAELPCMD